MFKKGKFTLITIVAIGLLGILSFKNKGIFAKEFIAKVENGSDEMIFETKEDFTIGIAKVHKTLKGENDTYYVLIKGEPVLIKDFKRDGCIIVNENGEEFQVAKDYIDLRNGNSATSRSGISRRTLTINLIIQNAHKAIGEPYIRGGTGEKGYDCSGLTYSLYKNYAGETLNRSSIEQAKNGIKVKKSELIPGDLLFFKTTSKRIGHVGLYVGDGNMIHVSSSQRKVVKTLIYEDYYKKRYVTARRILK